MVAGTTVSNSLLSCTDETTKEEVSLYTSLEIVKGRVGLNVGDPRRLHLS